MKPDLTLAGRLMRYALRSGWQRDRHADRWISPDGLTVVEYGREAELVVWRDTVAAAVG